MQLIQGLKYRVKRVDFIKNISLECIGYLNKWGILYNTVLYTFLLTRYVIGNNIIYIM